MSKCIRHCSVIDRYGNIASSMDRKNLNRLVPEGTQRSYAAQSALRYFHTPSWADNLGPMRYNLTYFENVSAAVIPFTDRHLVVVAFDNDKEEIHQIIMK